MKQIKLKDIAQALGAKLEGDPETLITGMNGILEAGEGDITFLANPKYKDKLPLCRASAIVVGEGVECAGKNLLITPNPRLAYAMLVRTLVPLKQEKREVSPQALVHPSAQLGQEVTIYGGAYIGERAKIGDRSVIYPGCFIGDEVEVGQDCLIYANVTILHQSIIGNRVVINPGTVVGSEGFGYERDGDKHFKIPQVGNVIIQDDVEIGALCAIDRGSIRATVLGQGTKLDNLIHIAHNCQLGQNNLVLSQAGLAGTVKTGQNVYFAGQTGCLDHINIVDRVQIASRSVVTQNIEEEGVYQGFPAKPLKEFHKAQVMFYKTDELRKKVTSLESRLKELEEKLGNSQA